MQLRRRWCRWWAGTTVLLTLACRPSSPVVQREEMKPAPNRAIVPLTLLQDRLAVCRQDPRADLPVWARAKPEEIISVTRTPDELSIIVSDSRAPKGAKCERDWRVLKVQGPLDFSLVGIIAGLSGTLADAGVSLFALSTYETDYVMVKQSDLERAVAALRQAGYTIKEGDSKTGVTPSGQG